MEKATSEYKTSNTRTCFDEMKLVSVYFRKLISICFFLKSNSPKDIEKSSTVTCELIDAK